MRRYRRDFRILAVACLALGLEAHAAEAGAQRPIIGQWCGVDDYVISVGPDGISFHARRGYYSPPAFDISVADDHADYRQRYEALEVTVSCRLSLQSQELATENCDNPEDSFYPKAGETAELHRCVPKPEPSV
ncbi:MAG TPA: hypothetical protein VMW18_11865 [Candidatus Binatia bacterium]|nr:hypothetical protein [Candidatus Binatia bacterium]